MGTNLEIIDYDVEGAAYRDGDGKGPIVDGHALTATVKRRPSGVLGEKPGEAVRLRILLDTLDPKVKAGILAAFDALESAVLSASVAHFEEQAASPAALDAKISAAAAAEKAKADAEAAKAATEAAHVEAKAQLDAINAQIAAANQLHAEKLAAVAAIPVAP